MTRRVIYVGGPYTHADHNIRRERFEALTAVAAEIVKQGHIVYSPITHTHPIDLHFVRDDVHLSSDFWCDFDETFMSVCTEMVIVPLEGWDKSSGVKRERAYFEAKGLPVAFYAQWDGRRMAETVKHGSVHESGGPVGICPTPVEDKPMSHKSTLLPCPFCGSLLVGERGDDGYVSCMNCKAYGPNGVDAWNTRTPIESPPCPELVERVANHIQLWWMTQKHEPMHRNDGLDLARAALSATRIQTVDEELVRLRAENERLSKAVCSGILGDLLTPDENEALVGFIKELRALKAGSAEAMQS